MKDGGERIIHHKDTKDTKNDTKNDYRKRHFLLLSFKDAMQTEGAEYGAGTAQGAPAALPSLLNWATIRCGDWRFWKNVCAYI
jgi:hypothetical protein